MRCSSRSTIIFLIVSKEIQKYDQRKFYFCQKRNIFKFGIHVHRWKKNCKIPENIVKKIFVKKICRKIKFEKNLKI